MIKINEIYINPQEIAAILLWIEFAQSPYDSDDLKGSMILLRGGHKVHVGTLTPAQIYDAILKQSPRGYLETKGDGHG